MKFTVDKYILGETDEELLCVNEEDNQQIAVKMIQQAEMYMDILSRDFDPDVYDNDECYETIEDLALRSRSSRLRVLLHNTKIVAQRGHLILNLGKRLGSLIQFRTIAKLHKRIPDTFLIVDGIGVMHRSSPNTLAATVNFKNRPQAKELTQLFEELWKDAELDLETRHLIL